MYFAGSQILPFIQISLNFVSIGSIDNTSALVQVISTLCLTVHKLLHGPMLTQDSDVDMGHYATMHKLAL